MSTSIEFIDRDELIAQMKAEREQRDNDRAIAELTNELLEARASLRHSEQALRALEESLGGKSPQAT